MRCLGCISELGGGITGRVWLCRLCLCSGIVQPVAFLCCTVHGTAALYHFPCGNIIFPVQCAHPTTLTSCPAISPDYEGFLGPSIRCSHHQLGSFRCFPAFQPRSSRHAPHPAIPPPSRPDLHPAAPHSGPSTPSGLRSRLAKAAGGRHQLAIAHGAKPLPIYAHIKSGPGHH